MKTKHETLAARKRRLADLMEQARRLSHQAGGTPEDEMLLQVVARTDAIFLPYRRSENASRGALWKARKAFPDRGCRWRAGGGSGAERTRASGRLRALVGSGKLKAYGGKTQISHVRITQGEYDRQRARCGLATLAEVLPALDVFLAAEIEQGGPWLSECALAETEYTHPRASHIFGAVQDDMLPLMVAGLVATNSDTAGRAYYSLTPAGQAEARRRADSGEANADAFPPDPAPGDDDALRLYAAIRRAERELLVDDDEGGEIGDIPLSASWAAQRTTPTAATCGTR